MTDCKFKVQVIFGVRLEVHADTAFYGNAFDFKLALSKLCPHPCKTLQKISLSIQMNAENVVEKTHSRYEQKAVPRAVRHSNHN